MHKQILRAFTCVLYAFVKERDDLCEYLVF